MNVVVFVLVSSDRGDVGDVICDIDFVKNAVVDVLVAAPIIVWVGGKNIVVIRLAVSYLEGEEDC